MEKESLEQKIKNPVSFNQNINPLKYIGRILLESHIAGLVTYVATNDINNSVLVGAGYGIFRIGFDVIDNTYFNKGRMYKAPHPTNHNQQ